MRIKFGILFVIVFMSSYSLNMKPKAIQSVNKKSILYEASCFEQGVYYSRWWGSVTGASALERMEVALAYKDACEEAKKIKWQEA